MIVRVLPFMCAALGMTCGRRESVRTSDCALSRLSMHSIAGHHGWWPDHSDLKLAMTTDPDPDFVLTLTLDSPYADMT